MTRIAVLGSTRGTHLAALVSAISHHELAAQIALVISNKSDALILQRARDAGLQAVFVDAVGKSRENYDREISQLLHQAQVELVVLTGYMRILSEEFVQEWAGRIINVHPSLLPAYAGKMDLDVHRSVLAAGDKETGCTVHVVTAEIDAGPILLQKRCQVLADDTPETLKARVQELEIQALIEVIGSPDRAK